METNLGVLCYSGPSLIGVPLPRTSVSAQSLLIPAAPHPRQLSLLSSNHSMKLTSTIQFLHHRPSICLWPAGVALRAGETPTKRQFTARVQWSAGSITCSTLDKYETLSLMICYVFVSTVCLKLIPNDSTCLLPSTERMRASVNRGLWHVLMKGKWIIYQTTIWTLMIMIGLVLTQIVILTLSPHFKRSPSLSLCALKRREKRASCESDLTIALVHYSVCCFHCVAIAL